MTHFGGRTSQPTSTDVTPAGTPANVAQPVASTRKTTPAEKPSATLAPSSQPRLPEPNKVQSIIDETAGDTHSSKPVADDESESTPEPAPLMVKGGKMAKQPKAADAPAPSMIGMATPDAGAPPANLVLSAPPSLRPTLSTLHVSQGVSTGLLIKKVAPSYPPNALRMHVEGDVDLVATISKEGNISNIKVTSGDAQLTKAAVDAVKQWKYKPYLLNGEPVEIQTQVTIKFKLPR
jgi:protein TonB